MGEGAPKHEEVEFPPAPPNTEAGPAEWEEYNRKREEWRIGQGERGNIIPLEDENPEIKRRKIEKFLDEHHADEDERQMFSVYLEKHPNSALYVGPGKLELRAGRSSVSFEEKY